MRRFVSLATLLVSSSLLTGCPIYPVDSCYSSYDCPNGYTCDSYLGQCVAAPDDGGSGGKGGGTPPPTPPDRDTTCVSPNDCADGETCGEKGFCLPGDCTFWGCVSGFACTETVEGKSFTCVENGTGGQGGASGAGGSGGQSVVCSSRNAPPAAGDITLSDGQEKFSFCLAGLQSDPSTSQLVTEGDRVIENAVDQGPLQTANLTISGQVASVGTIDCNALPADPPTDDQAPSAKCAVSLSDNGISQTTYESLGGPFTITVDTWTDTAFVGTITDVKLQKTIKFSGRPDTEQTEVDADLFISVRARVREGDGGTRPPPAP